MRCPRCGASADPSSATCPSCGEGLATPDVAATDPGLPITAVDETAVPLDSIASTPPRARAIVAAATGRRSSSSSSAAATGGGRHPRDLVGQRLGPRYLLRRLLGAGGMGAVYEAWDEELGVSVALKTVRPEVLADPETARLLERRFKQELLLARKVTHKNIVRVHDMGEVNGIKYITMPFIEGEDLATLLKRDGKLPVPRALVLARSVVAGLAVAHEAGVVHRDLKPANIMIAASGEGLVMDFGVARSVGGDASATTDGSGAVPVAPGDGQTMAGLVVGTLEFMSPEQARAEVVDQRADIYSFGLILYDALLGRTRSGRAKSAVAELQQRMREAPPPLRSVDPAIPVDVERIVMRCIQPEAADRFATTRELESAFGGLDRNGVPLPLVRRLTWPVSIGAALATAAILGGAWWYARPPAPPRDHEPVSILITDLKNSTGDPAFDGTLEPMLKLALEDAGFISAYDRNGIRRSLGVPPPDRLDENAGREIAVKQGVGVVLVGSITRNGGGYAMTLRAAESVTGNTIADTTGQATGRQDVLAVATSLGQEVRTALGDNTSESSRRFAAETLSATSLDVVREYASAMQALSGSRFDDARAAFRRATAADPNFGLAYAGMAIASANLGQTKEAQDQVKEAIRHVDRMTERERFRTRGLLYYLTNDYEACVKEYGDLLARFEADVAARNNLALCSTKLRQMRRARDEVKRVVEILPRRSLYRVNASLYSTYAGDFATAEQEATVAQELGDPWASQALALAKLGQGDLPAAAAAFQALGTSAAAGPSYTASGLADLALYQGQYPDAARLYAEGATADVAAGDMDRAGIKLVALAYTEASRGRRAEAASQATAALKRSQTVQVRFLAGRVLIDTGEYAQAAAIAKGLADELQVEPQTYGQILLGSLARAQGNSREAIRILGAANGLLDTWIGHFELGRALLDARAFPQADSEFDRCLQRRGEAVSLFLDEEPSSGYLPPVYYYLGRAREGIGTAAFADAYTRYLEIRPAAASDPLAADIRTRLAR